MRKKLDTANLLFAEASGTVPTITVDFDPVSLAAAGTDVVDCCCCWSTVGPGLDEVLPEAGVIVTATAPANDVVDVCEAFCC